MSTRSCIAKPKADGGWEGVYHHWDGYPSALGSTLWLLMQKRYDRIAQKLWEELINGNLEGWSTLNKFKKELDPKTWNGLKTKVDEEKNSNLPVSYQGDDYRSSKKVTEYPITDKRGDPLFIEWVYIIKPEGMEILAGVRVQSGGNADGYTHQHRTFIPWTAEEPDWDKIENMRKTKTK